MTNKIEVVVYDGPAGPQGPAPTGVIILTAKGGSPTKTNGCASPIQVEYGVVNLWVADFDPSSEEGMQWDFSLPSDWDGGTVTAVFKWLANSATLGDVIWGLQGLSLGNGEAVNQALGTYVTVTDTNTGQNYLNVSAATAAITLAGTPAGSEGVVFRAFRQAGNVLDTLNGVDARLWQVVLTFARS